MTSWEGDIESTKPRNRKKGSTTYKDTVFGRVSSWEVGNGPEEMFETGYVVGCIAINDER